MGGPRGGGGRPDFSPEEAKKKLEETREEVQNQVQRFLKAAKELNRETRERIDTVKQSMGVFVVGTALSAGLATRFTRPIRKLAQDFGVEALITDDYLEVEAAIAEAASRHGLQVANVFHAGDGNLHPLILYDANEPGQLETAERLGAEILSLCVAAGGTVTGEHGVGVEKIDSMCEQFTEEELAQFHALKAAFDPRGLLNPGKAVPTLHRCAELGAMHVHGGKLPFPDLPRF